jgi:putative transport protein
LLGVVVILAGGLTAALCIFFRRGAAADTKEFTAVIVGLLSGALTSTPAFSASKETVGVALEDAVTSGYAISYLFGVVGVVVFVQIVPKLLKANMEEERKKITIVDTGSKKKEAGKSLIEVDNFGFMPFLLAGVIGLLVGNIKFFQFFSLTTTGGCLITALVLGHFGRIGKISLMPKKNTLENLRELGLMFFLIGAGIKGGANFVAYFKVEYFIYGIFMTVVPMVVGFLFARYVLKLSLLNNLGSVTGAMTSTPALGTLINSTGTDDVASAYAATYPIALIAVVLVCQFLILLL